ncbi:PREDICTED: cytochrome P450 2U1-like [Thamnophis sirtalis]|uniref:Cytochrome P450 2U1-like n=1 Tax=Thamnophis sirtalis TaxID=35019 RepID=A0A6I9YFF2_9SAUR|nr:PREDICTED: cytochrome P450 2U1-like [Thamnophis sirtalis]
MARQLPFLDELINRQEYGSQETMVYHKAANTSHILSFNIYCHTPKIFRKQLKNTVSEIRKWVSHNVHRQVMHCKDRLELYEEFPWLMKYLPGRHQRVFRALKDVTSFAKQEIEKHRELQSRHDPQDFIDYYLLQMEKKVRREIEDKLDPTQSVCYQDRVKLPYTCAVIHEILRLKYVLIVGVPRQSARDVDLNGYHIPKAADICDPNPVMMLMLCVYLYERLPQYLPKKTLEFAGQLHATILRKIQLKNPSIKTLVYNATILGKESSTFSLPKGNTVTIPPKSQVKVNVEFTSCFLYPAEAVLLLVSKALTPGGFTMAISLKTKINSVKLSGILKCKSSCYQLKKYNLQVTSPFRTEGPFSVILIESTSCIMDPEILDHISKIRQGKIKSSEANFPQGTHDVIDVCGIYNQEENSSAGKCSLFGFLLAF